MLDIVLRRRFVAQQDISIAERAGFGQFQWKLLVNALK
jgi:hypothetical protein